jgi:hypothetical protein
MKLVAILAVVVVILGGGFFGLAKSGMVQVPGLSPAKKPQPEAPKEEPEKAKQAVPLKEKKAKPQPPQVQISSEVKRVDPEEGNARLAKLWNEVETKNLLEIVKDWKDLELAAVLSRMSADKVAELLAEMEPKRASRLSREIQKKASLLD